MEVPQEIGSLKDHQHNNMLVKGKRTKRPRPQSPIPFTMATNSSPIRDSGDEYYLTGHDNTNSYTSPGTSNEVYQDNTEEEDMANCLILLARGHHSIEHRLPRQLNEDAKFTSRRYLEAATGSGGGKGGYYVYECKTCGRSFPSFQALGGHRASHKKPKNLAAEERRQLIMLSSSDDEDTQTHLPSLSLQLSNNKNVYNSNNNNKSSKSHECSICGAEFTSGQALGGHMRRHRGSVNTAASTALSLTPTAPDSEDFHVPKKPRNVLSLELDLNLPASDNDHRQQGLKFSVASNQQQQQEQQQQNTQLVLYSPTFVDCHY